MPTTQVIPFRALARMYRSGHGISMELLHASGREQSRECLKALAACSRTGYSEPHEKDGIEFWRTHSNASHEFYTGVDLDGKMYEYAIGEGFSNHETPDCYIAVRDGDTEDGEIIGWWGFVESPIRESSRLVSVNLGSAEPSNMDAPMLLFQDVHPD